MARKKAPKTFLEKLQANESLVSRGLGVLVIVVVGVLLYNYFQGVESGKITPELETIEVVDTEVSYREEGGEIIPTDLPEKHVVQTNDSLWKIAETYYGSGYNWVDIAKANEILNPDIISSGQELSLPEVAVKNPLMAETDSISESKYSVQKGDSLWKIAVRAYGDGYRWPEIAQANGLTNPNIIEPDQILSLPRD